MALVEFQNVTRVYKTGDHELKALDGASFTKILYQKFFQKSKSGVFL